VIITPSTARFLYIFIEKIEETHDGAEVHFTAYPGERRQA
jgi:hypothetical protein